MAGLDALNRGNRPPLTISRVGEEQTPVRSVPREQQLADELDQRLANRLDNLRARLAGSFQGAHDAPNAPNTGNRLDMLA